MDKHNDIVFANSLADIKHPDFADATLHILCHRGELTITVGEAQHHIVAHDYAIIPNLGLVSQIAVADGFDADIMYLSSSFISTLIPHNDYGIFGHLSLLQNPVMQLTEQDFARCRDGIILIRQRLNLHQHLFYDEMMEHLVMVHVLDIYDIHARQIQQQNLPKKAMETLRKFVAIVEQGNYVAHRDLAFYANQLCITPHYLSEICKKATGEPATYWIDIYVRTEVARLLRDKTISFAEIAERLNFSSASYFTRYVQKSFGVSPSEFRNRLTRERA